MVGVQQTVLVILGVSAVASAVSFAAMWLDKRAARRGSRRISERRLHGFELAGGWPGSLLAQRALRHKNRKARYQFRFWAIVLVHLALCGLVVWSTTG